MNFSRLVKKVQAYLPPEKVAIVEDAYNFALLAARFNNDFRCICATGIVKLAPPGSNFFC